MPLPLAPAKPGTTLSDHAIKATIQAASNKAKKPVVPKPAPAAVSPKPAPATNKKPALVTKKIAQDKITPDNKHTIPPNHPAKTAKSPSPSPAPRSSAKSKTAGAQITRLFVLDTNVLLHDPTALFRFQEHDIFLPMIVLEELDAHKRGMTEVARNGRQTSRLLDVLAAANGDDMTGGLALNSTGHPEARGKLYFQTQALKNPMPAALPQGKADNQILGVVAALEAERAPREVVLVSKDINMRVKARALGLAVEDYQNDKTIDDIDLLYSGYLQLPSDFWIKQGKSLESWQDGPATCYRIHGPVARKVEINQFVYLEPKDEPELHARVSEIQGDTAVLRTIRDFTHTKHAIWGINARNREQNFALNLLTDPEVDFVSLAGTAGTGKTLLALATGLAQVLDDRRYSEIIVTRATVSVGEDIGFLPGTEEEKMSPWMGAFDDNLEFLTSGGSNSAGEWGRAATNDLVRSRIKVKSMNFMRGRTFMKKWLIIDEAQNLTPKQMKTLITRAGPGTKVVCIGNLAQIDTPYLTEGASGLAYVVERFKGWPHSGHVTLARGERSRLADFASDAL